VARLFSRRSAKRLVLATAPYIGADRLCRGVTRSLPRICMYHRFAHGTEHRKLSLAMFESQLDQMARHFKVVPMREVGRQLREHGRVEPGLAVITVDDGYADFHLVAAPALAKRGMSATFYITTEFLRGEFWLWPDRLEMALQKTSLPRLECSRGSWSLATEAEKSKAWLALVDICVELPTVAKDELVAEVLRELRVLLPARPDAAYCAITVDQLRDLAQQGFEIGAHTRTHPILSRTEPALVNEEIAGSKRELEALLDREVPSFCYPNGRHRDIGAVAQAAARNAGFHTAVAAYFAHDVLADPFEIKRYGPGDDPLEMNSFIHGFEHLIDRQRSPEARPAGGM
jgi:peptidoglycan/xylan/chitin deacetylase (PgdA/CDA1 family)